MSQASKTTCGGCEGLGYWTHNSGGNPNIYHNPRVRCTVCGGHGNYTIGVRVVVDE